MDSVWKFVMRKETSYVGGGCWSSPFCSLPSTWFLPDDVTSIDTGFLRRMTKLSALIIKNRVNLCTKIPSMSSACLMAIEMRTELIDDSINTRSFSLREMMTGLRRSSLLVLTSTSGLLCLSMTWELKLTRQTAASRVLLTAVRYGLRVEDILILWRKALDDKSGDDDGDRNAKYTKSMGVSLILMSVDILCQVTQLKETRFITRCRLSFQVWCVSLISFFVLLHKNHHQTTSIINWWQTPIGTDI